VSDQRPTVEDELRPIDDQLREEITAWIADDPDQGTAKELQSYLDENNLYELHRSFQGFLQFGTAGLRGRLGPGPSQMNRAVIARVAVGIAHFMRDRGLNSIVIGRDARYGSEDFANDSAEIFAGMGFDVYLLPRPLPTPVLAFALKELGLDAGIMVTASHNPASDNGYKVYLGKTVDQIKYNGSQIISPTDLEISAEIAKITSVREITRLKNFKIIDESIIRRYIHETASLVKKPGDIKVVYTAMHGVGSETLQSVFHAAGFARPILVDSQNQPDPDFPTVAFPNPEEPGAMDLAIAYARDWDADIVLANDPDADRCALAIKEEGDWRILRGDEIGFILGRYIAESALRAQGKKRVFANSIVSSSLLARIAGSHGIEFKETLTGFKWLAKVDHLTFGYEEALGYAVAPDTVNDKDGISAALLLTDLAAQLKARGESISSYLDEIWTRYGFYGTGQISIRLSNLTLINNVLDFFLTTPPAELAGYVIESIEDLAKPRGDLPATEGIRIFLTSQGVESDPIKIRLIIRPSGTEPKIKCYLEVVAEKSQAKKILEELSQEISSLIEKILR
jgi:phosphomannomutase